MGLKLKGAIDAVGGGKLQSNDGIRSRLIKATQSHDIFI